MSPLMGSLMATDGGRAGSEELDGVFATLADHDRRSVPGVVLDRSPDPLTPRDVATSLVPGYRDDPLDEETAERLRRALADLHLMVTQVLSPSFERIDRGPRTSRTSCRSDG